MSILKLHTPVRGGAPLTQPVLRYPIIIKSGILNNCGRSIRRITTAGLHTAVITDRTVGRLYLGKVTTSLKSAGFGVSTFIMPSGEGQKSLSRVRSIYDFLLSRGLERTDIIIALGGGVVGDIAGFTAATFLRGIRFVQIPTTLLAQADAGIGGKTGVNYQAKNTIGAFHQPIAVLIDPTVLSTLPGREFANGMAEVIKAGIIQPPFGLCFPLRRDHGGAHHSPALLRFLQVNHRPILARKPTVLESMLNQAVAIKANIVAQDPLETKGIRTVLNYGHTIGHALEKTIGGTFLSRMLLRHGEAIAIGMTIAAQISLKMGLTDQQFVDMQTDLLKLYHLPTALPRTMHIPKLLAALRMDKKIKNAKCYFVLPCEAAVESRTKHRGGAAAESRPPYGGAHHTKHRGGIGKTSIRPVPLRLIRQALQDNFCH